METKETADKLGGSKKRMHFKKSSIGGIVSIETRGKFRRWLSKSFVNKIYTMTSTDFCGSEAAPMTNQIIHRFNFFHDEKSWDKKGYEVVTFIDDGGEVGFGYHNKWEYTMRRKEFHKMILKYILIWIFKDWFGIRTKIHWYCLRKICNSRKKY